MLLDIVAVSDLHGTLPEIPPCDLLLIAGDICPVANHDPDYQAVWLDNEFRFWLGSQPARQSAFIAGNHDFVFQDKPHRVPRDLSGVYLQDTALAHRGLKIWGTPWQPWFHDWAFNLHEPQLEEKWRLIPTDTDILMVHGPPHGFGDWVPDRRGARRTGSPSLLARIEEIEPRLVVFGHIHEGRGQWQLGPTTLANVTLLNERYEAVHRPWRFQLALP